MQPRWLIKALLAAPLILNGAAPALAQSLEGTSWVVTKVQGVDVPPGLTLTFETDRVSGSTGCNQFWAPVDYRENRAIDIGAPQSKRIYCLGAMSIERAYLAALETVETFTIEDGVLRMRMHDGDVFIELTASDSQR